MMENLEEILNYRYLSDGIPAFECRTVEEKVKYCRRINGRYAGLGGIIISREKPCHVYRGDPSCQKCIDYRKYKRAESYAERLFSVSDSALSFVYVNDGKELDRLSRAARRRGLDILAIPISETEKVVFVNGIFEHNCGFGDLKAIGHIEAATIAKNSAGLMVSAKVSGNLGKSLSDEFSAIDDFDDDSFVHIKHRKIIFSGKNPSRYQDSAAYSQAMITLSNVVANRDNLQSLVVAREGRLLTAYEKMGLKPYFSGEDTRKYKVSDIENLWSYIEVVGSRFHGNMDALDPVTRELVVKTIEAYNDKVDEIDSSDVSEKALWSFASEHNIELAELEEELV